MRLRAMVIGLGLAIAGFASAMALTGQKEVILFGGTPKPVVNTNFLNGLASLDPNNYSYSTTSLRTITDSTGTITYAPNNLLTYSNTLTNGAWNYSNSFVTPGAIDPLGGTNAFTITTTASNGFFYQLHTLNANAVQTMWVRRRTGSGPIIMATPNNTSFPTITVDNTWRQFSQNSACAGNCFSIIQINTSGDAIDVYAPTLSAVTYETTPRPGDQVITTSAAYYGPAFDYNPTTLDPLGLRIEEARTNLFLNSGSPATQTITVSNGSAYTISFYGTGTLTLSGALTQTMTGSAYPARTTYTGTTSTTSLTVTVTSLGTMTYPQVELGAFATSAIPTGAASAARAADVVQIVGPALAVLKGTSVSIIAETGPSASPTSSPHIIGDSSYNSELSIISSNRANVYNGTELEATYGSGVNTTTTPAFRTASSFDVSGRRVVGGGGSVSSDNVLQGVFTSYYLGSTNNNIQCYNGHIRKLALYNRALTAAQLQARTILGAGF